jgi:hypothetical protein
MKTCPRAAVRWTWQTAKAAERWQQVYLTDLTPSARQRSLEAICSRYVAKLEQVQNFSDTL